MPDTKDELEQRARELVANWKAEIDKNPSAYKPVDFEQDIAQRFTQFALQTNADLIQERDRLREALEEYADESQWKAAMLEPGRWTVAKLKFNSGDNGYAIAANALAAQTGEQAKEVLKRMRGRLGPECTKEELTTLDHLLTRLEKWERLGSAAKVIDFGDAFISRLGNPPNEYGLCVSGEYGRGDYSSILDAFDALQENKDAR